MKTWWILALLAAVFALVGVGIVGGVLVADGPLPVVGIGALFLLSGAGLAWPVPGVRREQLIGRGELRAVAPAEAAGSTPWSQEELAGEVARAFADAPYVVEQTPGRIRVRADLADTRYLTLMGVRRVKHVVLHDVVVTGEGRCVLVDSTTGVAWSAGVDGAMRPRLAASASVFSGKAWGKSFRKEYGVGTDGSVGAQVDWSFDLAEVKKPTRAVLDRAGWQVGWPAEARVGLVVALVGASAIVVVPLAFLVRWLAG